MNENTRTNNTMSSYDKLYDGVHLPHKDEVAAAIAAVQRGRPGSSSQLPPLRSPSGCTTPGTRPLLPATTRSAGAPSLFRESFSFESTESETRRALTPTMAQLRARRILNESKNRRAVGRNVKTAFVDSDDEDDTMVDAGTLQKVGQFIDGLSRKKNGGVSSSGMGAAKVEPGVVAQVDVHSPGPTPRRGNVTTGATAQSTAAAGPESNLKRSPKDSVPYLPDDDSDTSISIDSSSSHDEDYRNVEEFIDALHKGKQSSGVEELLVRPETEEEMNNFIQSINTMETARRPNVSVGTNIEVEVGATYTVDRLEENVPTIADALNALSVAEEIVKSERVPASDGAAVRKDEESKKQIERKKMNKGSDSSNNAADGITGQAVASVSSKREFEQGEAAAPPKSSFYTPDAIHPSAARTVEKEPTTPVQSKAATVDKLKVSTTPTALVTDKSVTPFSPASSLGNSKISAAPASNNLTRSKQTPSTTPTARARMFLASTAGKPKTPVSKVPQTPASSINASKAPLTPSCRDLPSPKSPATENKTDNDANYQETLAHIAAQIQEVVRSEVPSITLGKVLAEANRRGITLDVVTEIYKQERFKFSSEKIAKWEAAAGISPKNEGAQENQLNASSASHRVAKDISTAALQEMPSPVRKMIPLTSKNESPKVDAQVMSPQSVRSTPSAFLSSALDNVNSTPKSNADMSTDIAESTDQQPAKPTFSQTVKETSAQSSSIAQQRKSLKIDTSGVPSTPISPASKPTTVERILTPRSKLDHFVIQIKEAVRSQNPSKELGIILAEAKKHHIPVNPLVELYTKERMALSAVPKDAIVSKDGADESNLVREKTKVSKVSAAVNTESLEGQERGLSDTQLQQLQQLISRSLETDDDTPSDVDTDVEKAAARHLEDIVAFFSRFAIDGVDAEASDKSSKQQEPKTADLEAAKSTTTAPDAQCNVRSDRKPSDEEVMGDDYFEIEQQDSSQFSERGNIAEVCVQNGNETVLYMQESSLEVEFVEPVIPVTQPPQKKKKAKKEKKKKKVIKIRPRDNRRVVVLRDDLPGYLGYWRSPWEKNRVRSHYYSGHSKNDTIDGVAAAARFERRGSNGRKRDCFLSKKERTKGHNGYRDIDFYSLYEATTVEAEDQDIDLAPWDYRDVRQRFLHEKSVESRNWFGSFELKRCNDRLHYPVSRPKSLQIQVTRIPDEDEWNENWYTTWRTRRDNPNNLIAFAELEIKSSSCTDDNNTIVEGRSSLDESAHTKSSKAPKRLVNIEIGTLNPVRLKTGERVSRVHPEYTSSLRRSRWRKKYVSGLQFPGS